MFNNAENLIPKKSRNVRVTYIIHSIPDTTLMTPMLKKFVEAIDQLKTEKEEVFHLDRNTLMDHLVNGIPPFPKSSLDMYVHQLKVYGFISTLDTPSLKKESHAMKIAKLKDKLSALPEEDRKILLDALNK